MISGVEPMAPIPRLNLRLRFVIAVMHTYLWREFCRWKVADAENKKVILKNCAPFIIWISKINTSTQVHNVKVPDIVMPIYPLLEFNDNY